MYTDQYVTKSLELHLFFGRIMKEHAFFLQAGFTPAEASFARKAEMLKKDFEKLLSRAIALSDGTVSLPVLCSGELVTEFTHTAEKQTEHLTGAAINQDLTRRTLRLNDSCRQQCHSDEKHRQVRRLNQTALQLLDELIAFKEAVLQKVLCCELFTVNYPLLIEHIIREAKLYRQHVECLEREGELSDKTMKETECFWNQIMMEHALFIRGLLDPTENELFHTADDFAGKYCALLESSRNAHKQTMGDAQTLTEQFRDFKAAGAEGIQQCKIRSLILPLLADHVLREANHYLRLLKC